jgi:purine-binding chemotaxis protein CheW
MKEIVSSTINPLPSDYRDRDTLGIASHMMQIPTDKGDQTVFLLDPERILDLANAPL